MTLRFHLTLNHKTITISGAAALILLVVLLCLPHLFAPSLSPERAQIEIRSHLKWQVTGLQMAELKAAGLRVPDVNMATRWKTDLDRIDRIEFASLRIRRFLLVPPFTSSRVFVVKATLREPGQTDQVRYFSLSADSKLVDFFWTVERPRWVWLLSI